MCVSHTGYLDHGNNKGEARGRSRRKDDSKIAMRYMERRNVGRKRKTQKQGLTCAEDLTIELTEGRVITSIL